jgi:methionine biosynthesis protein MetW
MSPYDRRHVDLDDETSSWTHVVRQVGRDATVLDLGCWDGLLLATLGARANGRGLGVERDPDAAARARVRGVEVVAADLDDPAWPDALRGRRFDAVVLADVLEHVRDPHAVLAAVRTRCLAPGGRVVLSVPNVAHGSVRLGLLLGAFERDDEGLLDRTHLHFWTRDAFHAVLARAGLGVAVEARVERPLQPEVVRKALDRAGLASDALVAHVVDDPDARTFQWVVTATADAAARPPPPAPPLHRDPLRVGDRAIARHVRKIGELQARVRVLEAGGPFRWLRYLKLKWRQRRARRDDARRG